MKPHLFVDISAHGLGHLAQAAPILNALRKALPALRLTIRSGLPEARLRARIDGAFTHIAARSDFGFVMHDAVRIDMAATATAYREQHDNWGQRVADEVAFVRSLKPDLVLTDVAYLPLAGAAQEGIPCVSMCSLNWADLFAHAFGHEGWAAAIHQQMLAAYNGAACFLRLTPGMEMSSLQHVKPISPVALLGQDRRHELREQLGCGTHQKLVLVAFGGFDKNLAAEEWPHDEGLRWLIPQSWPVQRSDMSALEPLGFPFTDLLRSVDAVLTKPGYGTFTEAACNGTPLLYLRRENWPEQEPLIEWLKENARCAEIAEADFAAGQIAQRLRDLWQRTTPTPPAPTGAQEAADYLRAMLIAES